MQGDTVLHRIFQPTILMTLALMSVIVMMILPMPPWVLDLGLAASFALAILIFTVTLFIEEPLDFSAFPTVLLASLMLRLSLNISSTKLIIGQGHTGTQAAGDVIKGFAEFVMGGSIFLGLVVFGVLLIVNFTVVTKGAARMAEVGARFALDAMPGKQLAIDSDISSGAIDHIEAKHRRAREQQETTFFGSLDGAAKFVKGDAIAGLLITLLNLVMGLAMGIFVHDMAFKLAFETYALLTVGDGLVSQLPSVIISIAAALLLSRGGEKGTSDTALFAQMGKYPAALATVSFLMAIFAFVPGLPALPFLCGAALLGGASYVTLRNQTKAADEVLTDSSETPKQATKSIGDILELDDIHVEFAADLVEMVLDSGTGLDARIANMRVHIATVYGVIMPDIRLTDNVGLPSGTYVIRIHGVEQARALLKLDDVLVLTPNELPNLPAGTDVEEPVYGAPARWISQQKQNTASLAGATIIAPAEVLATHLLEIIKRNFALLLTLKSLLRLLDEMVTLSDSDRAAANKKLLDELIPERVPLDLLHAVLRLLLAEQISIRNLPLILESVSEVRGQLTRSEEICEHVRQRLGFQLVADLRRPDGSLPLLQLAPEWEERFSSYQSSGSNGNLDIALPPELFTKLGNTVSELVAQNNASGIYPAIVTSSRRRRFLQKVLSAKGVSNPVLSFDEISLDSKPALVGVVAA